MPQTFLGAPNAEGQFAGINYATTSASCSATGSKKWDLAIGVPVTFLNDSVSGALSTSNTKDITVTITGVQQDTVPAAAFEDAINKLDKTTSAFMDAADGHHYLMNTAEAVTGLTIKYTLNAALSADIKAQIDAKTVQIGTSQTPAEAKLDVDASGQVVTLTSPSRNYVMGQFLQLKPVELPAAPPPPGVAQGPLQKRIEVESSVVRIPTTK